MSICHCERSEAIPDLSQSLRASAEAWQSQAYRSHCERSAAIPRKDIPSQRPETNHLIQHKNFMSSHLKTFFTIVCIIAALSILTYAGVLLYKQYTSVPKTSTTNTNIPSNPTETTPNTDSQTTPDTSVPSQQLQTSLDAPITAPEPPKSTKDTSPKTSSFIPQTIPSTDKNSHVYLPLSKISCENRCSQFTKNKELQYCQEYCGLEDWNTNDNCSDLKNLEQDYCFKAQAIGKTDPTICKKITDDNIRVACKNRVLEDIVDQQKSQ